MSAELDALKRAVDTAGSQAKFAERLSAFSEKPVAQAHVWYWLRKLQKAPPNQVLAIEAATGISRHELRPDIYPRTEAA
jgi:DNA-binding transcriptional regulator YdaS (Cro superfamily)